MNEHVEAQSRAPDRTLDFSNIVASCKTLNRCDSAHQDQSFFLTPLMDECETELKFKLSGRVKGLSPEAIDTIRVLNLGDNEASNRELVEERKQMFDALLFAYRTDGTLELEDDEIIQSLITGLDTPAHGKLEAFAPVAVNFLRGWQA